MREPKPKTPSPRAKEQRTETPNPAVHAVFKERLRGTDTEPGILPRLEKAKAVSEIFPVLAKIGEIPIVAETLLLTGHPSAAQLGKQAFDQIAAQYNETWSGILKTAPDASVYGDLLDTPRRIVGVLERVLQDPLLTTPVCPMELERALTLWQSTEDGAFRLLADRVLKARIHKRLKEQAAFPSLSHSEIGQIAIEYNDLAKARATKWEELEPSAEGWDTQTYRALAAEFKTFQSRAIALTTQNAPGPAGTNSLAWYTDFQAFEEDWFRFTVRRLEARPR